MLDFKHGTITELKSTAGNSTTVSSTYAPTATFGYAKVVMSSGGGVWDARVDVNLAPGIVGGQFQAPKKRVNFLVEYDGNPRGWTVHIGDDAINDGYGGGGAELQVLTPQSAASDFENTMLALYSTTYGPFDKVLEKRVSVKDGALRFSVANQEIMLGSPYEVLQAGSVKNLIALPGTNGDMKVFAGFNRVISGRPDRTGSGVSKVIISVEQSVASTDGARSQRPGAVSAFRASSAAKRSSLEWFAPVVPRAWSRTSLSRRGGGVRPSSASAWDSPGVADQAGSEPTVESLWSDQLRLIQWLAKQLVPGILYSLPFARPRSRAPSQKTATASPRVFTFWTKPCVAIGK